MVPFSRSHRHMGGLKGCLGQGHQVSNLKNFEEIEHRRAENIADRRGSQNEKL